MIINKKHQNKIDSFLKWRAWVRQTLGISISEFESLTPHEIDMELIVAEKIKEKKFFDFILKLVDSHFATLECIIYNSNYKYPAKIEDFKLLRDKIKKFAPVIMALDAKLKAAAQERIKKKGSITG